MFFRTQRARRAVIAGLTVWLPAFLIACSFLFVLPATHWQKPAAAHDDSAKKKRMTRRQIAREAWAWHRANQERLARTHPLGAEALTTEVPNQDVGDISVIQGDNRIITPATPFDLNTQAVQFAPSGLGYTVSAGGGSFDTNFGTKLNLTAAPAVNPKPQADPGDDAYLIQSLGFNFSYFGQNFSDVAISSNGNLTFRPGGVSQGDFDQSAVSAGESLAEFEGGLPRIAAYWHDLDASGPVTQGASGVYLRRDSDRVLITWNNIRDFPNDPQVDRGIHRFQITLFNTGRIVFTYDSARLTTTALCGVSPGLSATATALVNLSNPPGNVFNNAVGEFFSTSTRVDVLGAVQAFYATHPGRDVYDFVYLMSDFDFDLGDAFAFYLPIRNEVRGLGDSSGVGQEVFDNDPTGLLGSRRIQGLLNLSNLDDATGFYPASPTTRFLGANHALSIMGQEQGHRWLSYVNFPGNPTLLLGRDDAHWSFFMNIESSTSSPAARRSSSMEGNVWRDNGNGTFTSVNLIDGFSRLDHYLMGLRPPADVPETFVIAGGRATGRDRESGPEPNVNATGTRQTVSINDVIQANGARTPAAAAAPKSFRAAVILLARQGTPPSAAVLNKVARYRLAWESYFAQSTDFLGRINTGLADQTVSRVVAATSAASFAPTLAPGAIAALFGEALTTQTAIANTQPLPTTLAGLQVRIDGVPAPLFFASPGQVNFQVPRTTAATTVVPQTQSATALIEVFSNGQLIRAGAFQIAPAVPGIFTLNAGGSGPAAAVDAFTGAAGPFNARQANGQPNILAVFGTGVGAEVTDADGNAAGSVQATIDGAAATVNYAGRAPGFTGLNQFNIVLPANITAGAHTLIVSRNGIAGNEVTITIR